MAQQQLTWQLDVRRPRLFACRPDIHESILEEKRPTGVLDKLRPTTAVRSKRHNHCVLWM